MKINNIYNTAMVVTTNIERRLHQSTFLNSFNPNTFFTFLLIWKMVQFLTQNCDTIRTVFWSIAPIFMIIQVEFWIWLKTTYIVEMVVFLVMSYCYSGQEQKHSWKPKHCYRVQGGGVFSQKMGVFSSVEVVWLEMVGCTTFIVVFYKLKNREIIV